MEAKRLAAVTLSSLHEQRSDVHFDKIWEELLVKDGQYFHAGEQQSILMNLVVLLILMQHQKACTTCTILKFLTLLLTNWATNLSHLLYLLCQGRRCFGE